MTNKEFCKSEVIELSRMLAVCRVAVASTCLLMCAFLHSAIPKANAQDAGLGQSRVKIEADVSTRRIAVTSGFSGSEIIVFGTIVNAIPSDDEPYDVIIIMDGISQHLVTRRKSNVVGLWINTSSEVWQRPELLCYCFDSADFTDRIKRGLKPYRHRLRLCCQQNYATPEIRIGNRSVAILSLSNSPH